MRASARYTSLVPDDAAPKAKHAGLYATFALAPFMLAVLVALAILLLVAADHGWWWAFWLLVATEVYLVVALFASYRHGAKKRKATL